MILREMRRDDLEQVIPIENANFSRPWTKNDFSAYLNREDGFFLVAEEDGEILGYCGVIMVPPEGDITDVSVSPDHRGKGVGRALLAHMLKSMEEKGVTTLFLEVRKSNAAAIGLYTKQGFKEIGVRKKYYEAPEEDALIMTREASVPG